MNRDLIAKLITKHEGSRNSVYTDTTGNLTIGVGFNLDAPGARQVVSGLGIDYDATCAGQSLSNEQIQALLDQSLNGAIGDAEYLLPNFAMLPDNIQAVVVDMAFNLGRHGLSQFVGFLGALRAYNYPLAAAEAKNSLWCGQVKSRCDDNCAILKGGPIT